MILSKSQATLSLMNRPYEELLDRLGSPPRERTANMQAFVDYLWPLLHPTGVSWLGFYVHDGGDELVLGPRRDKPACSPIGMHGACGKTFLSRKPMVVRDVKELGPNYIACDPRDQSEVIIPLIDESGECWGVLDLDSYEVGSFSEVDVSGLQMLLRKSHLTA